MYHEWAPYYPLPQAHPVDYHNLPCTYFDPDGSQFTGFFSLTLPGFRLDYAGGATWSPLGGDSSTSFDILCFTPSPPPSPPRWVRCGLRSWLPANDSVHGLHVSCECRQQMPALSAAS